MRDRRVSRLVTLLALATLLLIPGAPTDAAEDVTGAELRRLAARAEHDPSARNELLQVRRVDGRPVDLPLALRGATEDDQRARLRTLAAGSTAPAVDAAAIREDARRVLDDRRFKPAQTPRPLRGLLRRIGEWLQPITDPLNRTWNGATDPWWGRLALAAAAFVAALLVAARIVRHRAAAVHEHGVRVRTHADDPRAFEREADAAEQAGDYDAAVRLRFRAGLLRLDRTGAVRLHPSLTAGRLTQQVPIDTLHELASTFEAVAYGGEHADADDAAAARRDWPRVLQEVGRR